MLDNWVLYRGLNNNIKTLSVATSVWMSPLGATHISVFLMLCVVHDNGFI